MKDFKLIGHCVGCKRNRLFIRKRELIIPDGPKAISRDLLCTRCFKRTLKGLSLTK